MIDCTYHNTEGVLMRRVSKTAARKIYETGGRVLILGCNCNPMGLLGAPASCGQTAAERHGQTFDAAVAEHSYYTPPELGRYMSFYTPDNENDRRH